MHVVAILIIVVLLGSVHATLHCATQQDAVASVYQACLNDKGCKAYYKDTPLDEFTPLVVEQLQLVRDWDDALSALGTAFHGDDDTRHFFWPEGWLTQDPTLVSFGTENAPVCNSSTSFMASTLPVPELRDVVHHLVLYKVFLAQERLCDSESETSALDPVTGEQYCMAVADHVCASSTGVETDLMQWAYVLLSICLVCVTLANLVPTILFVRTVLLLKKQSLSAATAIARTDVSDDTRIPLVNMSEKK